MSDSESAEAVVVARLAWRTIQPSELGVDAVDWSRVFELAARERCASLVWIRNASLIRALAPADLAARWRGRTLSAGAAAREQVVELSDVVTALEAAGVAPIVLKGLPLSQLLYEDVSARPVTDIDLFVPVTQREAAHEELCRI
ncbi:MAG: hypothetical protein HOQ09_04175, partial [Gemmatimonadaceae bacterium]|nr:hypothetical protein [Gemmatimonadaceae bacterium]